MTHNKNEYTWRRDTPERDTDNGEILVREGYTQGGNTHG